MRLVAADTLSEEGVRVPVPRLDLRPRRRAPPRAASRGFPRSRDGRPWPGCAPARAPARAPLGTPTPAPAPPLADFLGTVDADLASFDLASHVLYRRIDTVRRANWKLVIDAFLRRTISVLHRDTIYRFFLDASRIADFVGPHVRSVTAPRGGGDAEGVDLREALHVHPLRVPELDVHLPPRLREPHRRLPRRRGSGAESTRCSCPRRRPARVRPALGSHAALIEETVFQREDLFAAEGIQAGIASGANARVTFGRLEGALAHFHATIERELGST